VHCRGRQLVFQGGLGTGVREHLTVSLGHTLNLVLLLDSVAVGRSLGGINDLIRQALRNCLDITERSLAGPNGEQVDCLAYTSERRYIDGLTTDDTSRSDTRRVLSWSSVDNGVNKNLDRIAIRKEVDNLEAMAHDIDAHHLLTTITSVKHERVDETLHKGAL